MITNKALTFSILANFGNTDVIGIMVVRTLKTHYLLHKVKIITYASKLVVFPSFPFKYIFRSFHKVRVLNSTDTAVNLTQLTTRQKLNAQQKRCSKSTNFYQRGQCISVSQRVSRARQVPRDLPVHPVQEDTKEPGDEEDRKERLETREIEVLWDRQEKSGKQGIVGPVGLQGEIGSKGEKGDKGPVGMPGTKGEPCESISSPAVVVSPVTLTVNEGGTASFVCSASGNPGPGVTWSKLNGQSQITQSAVLVGKLELKKVTGSYSGVYQCSGTNILGNSQGVLRLAVNGKFLVILNADINFPV